MMFKKALILISTINSICGRQASDEYYHKEGISSLLKTKHLRGEIFQNHIIPAHTHRGTTIQKQPIQHSVSYIL